MSSKSSRQSKTKALSASSLVTPKFQDLDGFKEPLPWEEDLSQEHFIWEYFQDTA